MRGKKAKKLRKLIYGDYSHNLHREGSTHKLREIGRRLRKQYQKAKKER